MSKILEKRMYFLTMYNLLSIQKGIQSGHAALEYVHKYRSDDEVWDFIENHKTWMVLNGGTSNDATQSFYGLEKAKGSMEEHLAVLEENGVKTSVFHEPDLNYALSSICLIVDERVFNSKDFPAFPQYLAKIKNEFSYTFNMNLEEQYVEEYKDWIKLIGGKKNVFLKEFLSPKNFRLA